MVIGAFKTTTSSGRNNHLMSETNRHESDTDHELWMRCFTAALNGVTAAQLGTPPKPQDCARMCGEIADAALEEERRRRRDG